MLYYLFEYLQQTYDLPGAGLFQYVSFRSAAALILSLIISIIIGEHLIRYLQRLQVGETVRELGLEGQKEKEGTPTMGGIIIVLAIIIPTILLAKLSNIYIILMLIATLWMAFIGGYDDYIKVFKKDKSGLKGKFKLLGQMSLGLLVGCIMMFHDDVVVRLPYDYAMYCDYNIKEAFELTDSDGEIKKYAYVKTGLTTVPFFKNNNFDYRSLLTFLGEKRNQLYWIFFIPAVIFILTAVSNASNLTDGLDGLAAGTSAIIALALTILAYVSSNVLFSDYLNILYLPHTEELVIFCAAFVGACVGFLWYNSYPAKIFMGDTGSLALGSVIATLAIILRKELMIPLLCGVFFMEALSVTLQVSYFKYTKRKFGEGRRIFLMSPLHHHYQKLGMHESKIVSRFWIVGIMLAVLTIVTLKVR